MWTVRTCEVVVRVKLKAVAFSSLFPIAIHHYSLSLSKLFSATFPSPTHTLSHTNTQKSEKKRWRDGFAELVSSFALYFTEISELVLSFLQSSLALYFIVIVGSIVLSFLQH